MSDINSDITNNDAVIAREEAGSTRQGWKPIQVQVSTFHSFRDSIMTWSIDLTDKKYKLKWQDF